MILKIVGMFLITFSCGTYGYLIKYKHIVRVRGIENFLLCFDILSSEITINSNTICNSFIKVINYADEYNRTLFNKTLELYNDSDGDTISCIWETVINETFIRDKIYSSEDVDVLKKFGTLLGCGDINLQKDNIDNVKLLLNKHLTDAKLKNDKVNNTAKLGLYIGIIISVVLI